MPAVAKKTKARKTTTAKAKTKAKVKLRVVKKSSARKAPARKTSASKKTAVRKSPARKTTAAKKATRSTATKKVVSKGPVSIGRDGIRTKSELFSTIAERSDVSKKDVSNVIDALSDIIGAHIKKRGPGKISLPGLMKIEVKVRPATKARRGINPFTGEETIFKAKPASRRVKITALKKLKDMAK